MLTEPENALFRRQVLREFRRQAGVRMYDLLVEHHAFDEDVPALALSIGLTSEAFRRIDRSTMERVRKRVNEPASKTDKARRG